MISDSLGDCGGMPGRDTFIELLRQNDLMVRMRRRKHYRTTYSEHNYRKYPNLVKGVIPTRPNQIWVADITYVETDEGVCYLSLVTEWLYKMKFPTREKCRSELERIIQFYNSQRPHMSIGMQTPNEAHGQEGPQKRCWKTPRERREAGKKISLEEGGPVGGDNPVG